MDLSYMIKKQEAREQEVLLINKKKSENIFGDT
jgi:hypothetical protein